MALDNGFLLSTFVCKRDDEYLSNPRKILPTLAYRFAQQHDSYRIALVKLFHDGSHGVGIAEKKDIATQRELLFNNQRAS